MGPRGTGSCFQRDAQRVALKDAIGKVVETRIDDAIAFALSRKELMTRLDAALSRLKSRSVSLSPEKIYDATWRRRKSKHKSPDPTL